MNSHYQTDENNDKPTISEEIKNTGDDLRRRLALRRQKLQGITERIADVPPLSPVPLQESGSGIESDDSSCLGSVMPQQETGNARHSGEIPLEMDGKAIIEELDDMIPVLSEEVSTNTMEMSWQKKDIQTIIEELAHIEENLDEAFPTFSLMTLETKRRVMTNIADQERNWEDMRPEDIKIDKEEIGMWSGFFGTAKKDDFIKERMIESLESGEIVDLVIDGFESFQIVKIRAKNKNICAMSVVEFVKRDEKKGRSIRWSGDYLITLPLIEGETFSILKKETMEPLVNYRIRKMSLNKQHRSLIRKLLDLFV